MTAPWRCLAACSAAMLLLSGCGIFGDDEDELKPNELLDFEQTLPVERAWSANLGGGSEFLRLALSPAGNGQQVFAASRDGVVTAFDPATGDRLWRTELELPLSAGPGAGDERVLVASSDGFLIALSAADGHELWRTDIAGESLARPVVSGDSVVVSTIDGKLRALSAVDGSVRWTFEQTPPPLTLRGSSDPVVIDTTVVAGFDNGRVVALDLSEGETLWQVVLSPPAGRSDLERLADIDGSMAAVGEDLYAVGYQGRLAELAAESGQVLWSREISTRVGLSADSEHVYIMSDADELMALDRQNGTELWRQGALLRRRPTAPVSFGDSVVVGDFEGYVHFFSKTDGTPVARVRVDNRMLSGAPVAIGDKLYVQSESGRLEVFEVLSPESPEPPEDDAG